MKSISTYVRPSHLASQILEWSIRRLRQQMCKNCVIGYFLIFDTSVQLWTLELLWSGRGVKKL